MNTVDYNTTGNTSLSEERDVHHRNDIQFRVNVIAMYGNIPYCFIQVSARRPRGLPVTLELY